MTTVIRNIDCFFLENYIDEISKGGTDRFSPFRVEPLESGMKMHLVVAEVSHAWGSLYIHRAHACVRISYAHMVMDMVMTGLETPVWRQLETPGETRCRSTKGERKGRAELHPRLVHTSSCYCRFRNSEATSKDELIFFLIYGQL